jgi:hypothetical protein
MRVRASALLCELHAHTTWSDGELSLAELVDLYGTAGFDILCVTDHVLRSDDPWPAIHGRSCLEAESFDAYCAEIDRAFHAVALDARRLIGVDEGPAAAIEQARDSGAAVVVAHPYDLGHRAASASQTRYFARRWRRLEGLYHRIELFNGRQLFAWVAESGLLPVAAGDLHRPDQLPGWTTLIPCEQDPEALVDYLRSRRPVFLARLERESASRAA